MTRQEFKEICKSIIPDGFFKRDIKMGTLDFMCKYKVEGEDEKRMFHVAYLYLKEESAGIVIRLPWKNDLVWYPHTSNKETFAKYLKSVIPP